MSLLHWSPGLLCSRLTPSCASAVGGPYRKVVCFFFCFHHRRSFSDFRFPYTLHSDLISWKRVAMIIVGVIALKLIYLREERYINGIPTFSLFQYMLTLVIGCNPARPARLTPWHPGPASHQQGPCSLAQASRLNLFHWVMYFLNHGTLHTRSVLVCTILTSVIGFRTSAREWLTQPTVVVWPEVVLRLRKMERTEAAPWLWLGAMATWWLGAIEGYRGLYRAI